MGERFLSPVVAFLALALLLPSARPRGQVSGVPSGTVEIRQARREAAPGYIPAGKTKSGQTVFLRAEPLFTGKDLADARLASIGGTLTLLLSFEDRAAKRLEAFTRKSRGELLAILLDGEVLEVTAVGEPIVGGEMALVTELSYAEATAFVRAVRADRGKPAGEHQGPERK